MLHTNIWSLLIGNIRLVLDKLGELQKRREAGEEGSHDNSMMLQQVIWTHLRSLQQRHINWPFLWLPVNAPMKIALTGHSKMHFAGLESPSQLALLRNCTMS